jgi:hypothetical protein
MPSHIGPIVVGAFPQEAEPEELGDSKHQAPQRLSFPFSKTSPNACSTYKMQLLSLALLCMHVMYCAPHVGFLDDDGDSNCMLYPSLCTLVLEVFIFIN